jgi:hypothetical protein
MKTDAAEQTQPSSLVGTVRRFGKNGTLYEVLRRVDDASVMIHVLDTQEETLYPIAAALRDPDQ